MVCFDVGETLVDETEVWGSWADLMGIPRLTFFAALGAVIERGGRYLDVFELVQPGFDAWRELRRSDVEGGPGRFTAKDLYPDVVPAMAALSEDGYRLAIAGNQPVRAERALLDAGLPVELIAASDSWGVHKPSPAFFERLLREVALRADQVAYVGDRVDNDVVPAAEAGLVSVFIRRGPWGYLQADRPEVGRAALRISSLSELRDALATWSAEPCRSVRAHAHRQRSVAVPFAGRRRGP
jgi:HAD superfamily hydrolase (TIGR01662 family)